MLIKNANSHPSVTITTLPSKSKPGNALPILKKLKTDTFEKKVLFSGNALSSEPVQAVVNTAVAINNPDFALEQATRDNDVEFAVKALQYGANPHGSPQYFSDEYSRGYDREYSATYLTRALQSYSTHVAGFLLNQGVEPRAIDLSYAARCGDSGLVDAIIRKGIHPSNGIHTAVCEPTSSYIAGTLFERGADPNAIIPGRFTDHKGNALSPIDYALFRGQYNTRAIEYLLKNGAKFNPKLLLELKYEPMPKIDYSTNPAGVAYQKAAREDRIKLIQILTEHFQDEEFKETLESIKSCALDIEIPVVDSPSLASENSVYIPRARFGGYSEEARKSFWQQFFD